MEWWVYLIIALVVVLVSLPLIGMGLIAPNFVFSAIFKRQGPDSWSRNKPSDAKNKDISQMWDESIKFRQTYKEEEIEVVTSDNLKLKGLYYDTPSKTAVIILPGRPESCIYSLYYAYPYIENGVSVCAPDLRAHGNSEGAWSGLGYKEQEDVLAFAKYLHDVKGKETILLHGICVGSSAASYVIARQDCPSYIKGVFTDGMFATLSLTLKPRLKRFKAPIRSTLEIFRIKAKKLYGIDIKKDGPIKNVKFWNNKVVTIIASKEDIYSLPKYTKAMYDSIPAQDKKLVWWEHGEHSHLRIYDKQKYDETVTDFISRASK